MQAAEERRRADLRGRERLVTLLSAGAFLVAAVACAVLLPSEVDFSPWLAVGLIVLYVVVSRIEFEIGPGSAVPTELVLVPMLFVLPPGAVPLCVAVALVGGAVFDRLRGRLRAARITVLSRRRGTASGRRSSSRSSHRGRLRGPTSPCTSSRCSRSSPSTRRP